MGDGLAPGGDSGPYVTRTTLMNMLFVGSVKPFSSSLFNEGFDPGSERTLAAWLRHASRTRNRGFGFGGKVA